MEYSNTPIKTIGTPGDPITSISRRALESRTKYLIRWSPEWEQVCFMPPLQQWSASTNPVSTSDFLLLRTGLEVWTGPAMFLPILSATPSQMGYSSRWEAHRAH